MHARAHTFTLPQHTQAQNLVRILTDMLTHTRAH